MTRSNRHPNRPDRTERARRRRLLVGLLLTALLLAGLIAFELLVASGQS